MTTTASSAASPTCTGSTYSIKTGDTCNSVALSQGTATWYLLLDNSLPAYCADFPTTGSLCEWALLKYHVACALADFVQGINHPCKSYTVKNGDTCTSVASSNNVTTTQLLTYNPWIDVGCWNFNNTVGRFHDGRALARYLKQLLNIGVSPCRHTDLSE